MGRIVNNTELAEIFGVSKITIYNYQKEGMPVVKEGSKGIEAENDTSQCIDWFANKRNKDIEYTEERARLTKLQADKVQIEIDLINGEIIKIEDVKQSWEKSLGELRSMLLSLPSNITPSLMGIEDESEVQEILNKKIKEILNNVAG